MSEERNETGPPSGKTSFIRYNISAIIATVADFLTLIILTELLNVWYLISTVLGALVGAIIAFSLGRNWAFVSKREKKKKQAFRYLIVAMGSIALNSAGVYLFTDILGFQYVVSKSITAVMIAIGYNYPLSKYYTFRHN